MNIKKKDIGLNIKINLDSENYYNFLKDIKALGKKYEFQSNADKLDYSIIFNAQRNPYMDVFGWCSRVVNKDKSVKEVLFIDYDHILFRIVEDELNFLMSKYNMSPFYIFKTHEETDENGEVFGNYLAISLTKKTFKEVIDMQDLLHCDAAYKKIPLLYRFRTWVLRMGKKGEKKSPEFKCIFGDLSKEYDQDVSEAHLDILKELYQIPDVKYTQLDGNKKLFLTKYETAST